MLYLETFSENYLSNYPVSGIIIPPVHDYLKRLYIFNRDAIVNYYHNRNYAVKNTNILSRLLEQIPILINYDDYAYVDYMINKSEQLTRLFRFTSDITYGEVHTPYFFGNNGEEIIISIYEPFNIKEVGKNWKNEKAIQVLKCDRVDTRLLLPLGKEDGCRNTYSVIMINIPKLALIYRKFIIEQMLKPETEIKLNKNHFVIKYVLPSMIEDIIDFMFLNRIMAKFYQEEIPTPNFRHKFKLFEPTEQLNQYVDTTLDVITSKKIDFINLMNNINLIFRINMTDMMILPELANTRQVKWSLLISRLPYMKFIYDVSKHKDTSKHIINDWKRAVTRAEKDSNFTRVLEGTGIEKLIKEKIKEIKEM